MEICLSQRGKIAWRGRWRRCKITGPTNASVCQILASLVKSDVTSYPDVICAALMDLITVSLFINYWTKSPASHRCGEQVRNWGGTQCAICRKISWISLFCVSAILGPSLSDWDVPQQCCDSGTKQPEFWSYLNIWIFLSRFTTFLKETICFVLHIIF